MPTILNLNRKHTSERYFDEVHFKHLLTQVFLFAPVMLSNEAQCSSPHPSTKVPQVLLIPDSNFLPLLLLILENPVTP